MRAANRDPSTCVSHQNGTKSHRTISSPIIVLSISDRQTDSFANCLPPWLPAAIRRASLRRHRSHHRRSLIVPLLLLERKFHVCQVCDAISRFTATRCQSTFDLGQVQYMNRALYSTTPIRYATVVQQKFRLVCFTNRWVDSSRSKN